MNSGRKVGRFKMSEHVMANANLQQLIDLQKNMFVLDVDQSSNLGFVVITAIHPDFDELNDGDFMPFYDCEVRNCDGNITATFKRVE